MFSEDYNDYEEYESEVTSAEEQEYLDKVKDHLARANWQAVKVNGVNVDYYKGVEEINTLKEIIQETLEYFEDIEEYDVDTR